MKTKGIIRSKFQAFPKYIKETPSIETPDPFFSNDTQVRTQPN